MDFYKDGESSLGRGGPGRILNFFASLAYLFIDMRCKLRGDGACPHSPARVISRYGCCHRTVCYTIFHDGTGRTLPEGGMSLLHARYCSIPQHRSGSLYLEWDPSGNDIGTIFTHPDLFDIVLGGGRFFFSRGHDAPGILFLADYLILLLIISLLILFNRSNRF